MLWPSAPLDTRGCGVVYTEYGDPTEEDLPRPHLLVPGRIAPRERQAPPRGAGLSRQARGSPASPAGRRGRPAPALGQPRRGGGAAGGGGGSGRGGGDRQPAPGGAPSGRPDGGHLLAVDRPGESVPPDEQAGLGGLGRHHQRGTVVRGGCESPDLAALLGPDAGGAGCSSGP